MISQREDYSIVNFNLKNRILIGLVVRSFFFTNIQEDGFNNYRKKKITFLKSKGNKNFNGATLLHRHSKSLELSYQRSCFLSKRISDVRGWIVCRRCIPLIFNEAIIQSLHEGNKNNEKMKYPKNELAST